MRLLLNIDDEDFKEISALDTCPEIPEWVVSEAEGTEIQIAEIIQNHISHENGFWMKGTNMTIKVVKDDASS